MSSVHERHRLWGVSAGLRVLGLPRRIISVRDCHELLLALMKARVPHPRRSWIQNLIYLWQLGWSCCKGSGAPRSPSNPLMPLGSREHHETFQDSFGSSLKEKEKKTYFYPKTTKPLWGALLLPGPLFYRCNSARRMCVLFSTDMPLRSLSSSVSEDWSHSEVT